MMKILVVNSTYSKVPLCEVRTDGHILDFIVDNTEGKFPRETAGRYDKLMQIVGKSSHLSISQPDKAAVGLHRYMLNNGDVVEVTTDAKTAVLNGRMLNTQERDALFAAIQRREIRVTRKANIEAPIPILGAQQQEVSLPKPPTGFDPMVTDELKRQDQEKRQIAKRNSAAYDEEIEKADLRGAEDPTWVKQMLYQLKYGGQ
jgi:hypothetical protein